MTYIRSEVTDLDTGLLLEVWEKGMLWDKAIGYYWCPLNTIPFSKQVRTFVLLCRPSMIFKYDLKKSFKKH